MKAMKSAMKAATSTTAAASSKAKPAKPATATVAKGKVKAEVEAVAKAKVVPVGGSETTRAKNTAATIASFLSDATSPMKGKRKAADESSSDEDAPPTRKRPAAADASGDEGETRDRNKQTQWDKGVKNGTVSSEMIAVFRDASRADKTKIVNSVIQRQPNGGYIVCCDTHQYKEIEQRFIVKSKSTKEDGYILEVAERLCGGPEKLKEAIKGGRVTVLHIYIYIYIYMYIYIHTYIYIYMISTQHVSCLSTCVCVCVCVSLNMCVRVSQHVLVSMNICASVCVCVRG